MFKIAEVLINIAVTSLDKTFSYIIPPDKPADIGSRVLVPFGPRQLEGFVLDIAYRTEVDSLKSIIGIIGDTVWFDEQMVKTATWLSKYYLCSRAEAFRLFLIGRSGIKTIKLYKPGKKPIPASYANVTAAAASNPAGLTAAAICRQSKIDSHTLAALVRKGYLHVYEQIKPSGGALYKNVVRLAVEPQEVVAAMEKLQRRPAQKKALAVLIKKKELWPEDLAMLHISRDTIKHLTLSGLVKCDKVRLLRDAYTTLGLADTPHQPLTAEQQQAFAPIKAALEQRCFKSFLLHGITGSGKTRVYIEAAAIARALNRQVIILVPEIALTHQIVKRFRAKFGSDVVVMHSRLSSGEKYDAWQRLRDNSAGIVIGARSAVFAPLSNIGLIIIDEEHEFTYKQEESPHYHARTVALYRAKEAAAAVILGSATPSLESYLAAVNGKHQLLTMHKRANTEAALPNIRLVDMRAELRHGNRSVLSRELQELLKQTLTANEQAIILINRRGYSTFVNCRECGLVLRCPHCAVALVYHNDGTLRCHYCGQTIRTPDTCPKCGSHYIRYFGTGTQKVESELARLFPMARIIRMDQDTTGGKMAHNKILTAFSQHKYDILLGTQMVAKGHDIKNVTAVGIIAADSSLNIPDFRANERTFALLTQAAGRAGRGKKPGTAIIQTYDPEHFALQAVVTQNYEQFFQTELAARRELSYPPFSSLIKLVLQDSDDIAAMRNAQELSRNIQAAADGLPDTAVIGPFPAAVARVKDIYRVNIIIKTCQPAQLKSKLSPVLARYRAIVDVDPLDVI